MADLVVITAYAEAVIEEYLDSSWSFGFDHAKRRAGLCNFSKRRISVSRYLAEVVDLDQVQQTVLHEVAHALAGPDAGHGELWRTTAAALGYRGERISGRDLDEYKAPWMGTCREGHVFYRYREPRAETSCSLCHRGFSRAHLVQWHRRW